MKRRLLLRLPEGAALRPERLFFRRLIAMVANLTLGKEKYAAVEGDMKEVAAKAAALKDDFLASSMRTATPSIKSWLPLKCPRIRTRPKKARSAAIQDATKGAALVPFKVGQKANELFALAETVITKGNQNAITDGAVAAMNARAAVRGAFLNVKINLGSIKDTLFVEDLKKRMAEIEKEVDAREKALLDQVKL